MNIGFVGLGKLGLPCALAIESKGHKVLGFDIDPFVNTILENKKLPYLEENAQELLDNTRIKIVDLNELVSFSDIIFVAIQTPHEERYEGIDILPRNRKDFNYSYLKLGIKDLCTCFMSTARFSNTIIAVISTVLPGTMRREILPYIPSVASFVYNPFFIAMGTTIHDFLNPEFVLVGTDDDRALPVFEGFYKTIHDKPIIKMSIESAELCKVAYNTIIGTKIIIANTMMEICHNIPNADVDDVMNALKLATDRIVSPKYMNAGMGDGGACHPRDNIAMSWLARKLDLSHNIFDDLMLAREDQTFWLAELAMDLSKEHNLPIAILGQAYKKGTNLTIGSCSILLENVLLNNFKVRHIYKVDPYISPGMKSKILKMKAIFVIGTNHAEFKHIKFREGSIVLDPWGYMPDQKGVDIIRIGRNGKRKKEKKNG